MDVNVCKFDVGSTTTRLQKVDCRSRRSRCDATDGRDGLLSTAGLMYFMSQVNDGGGPQPSHDYDNSPIFIQRQR